MTEKWPVPTEGVHLKEVSVFRGVRKERVDCNQMTGQKCQLLLFTSVIEVGYYPPPPPPSR